MTSNDDDFGDFEDDELIQAATQVEHNATSNESSNIISEPAKRSWATAFHQTRAEENANGATRKKTANRTKFVTVGGAARNGTEDQLEPALNDESDALDNIDCGGLEDGEMERTMRETHDFHASSNAYEKGAGQYPADGHTPHERGSVSFSSRLGRGINSSSSKQMPSKLSAREILRSGWVRTNGYAESDNQRNLEPSKDAAQELANLPSDAFASSSSSPQKPQNEPIYVSSQPNALPLRYNALAAPKTGLRQTTLFGGDGAPPPASQINKRRNWPLADKNEPPTHHKLVEEALGTWVYPTNLGTIRDYQFNIVARGLFHNLLVALPTGLGKTFIAATIMLNWFRWTKDAQIVFVAPTKPLVSQQVEACFGIAGIPRSQTTMLTGGIPPGLRAEEWLNKRVFFMTPQTIVNDLKTGICEPKRIVLLVVDEAHRATGGYAYVEVVKFIRRFNESFRVLALTATPGSKVEQVQEVIDGLDISRVEIRTEHSLDIRQYVHKRQSETILFDNTEEMEMLMDLFSKALSPVLSKLNSQNAYWAKDPMTLTPYGLTQARAKWAQSDAGRKASMGVKAMVHGIFTVLSSLAHSVGLLKYHGIGPFYHNLVGFRNSVEEGGNGSKYRKQINNDENFIKLMTRVRAWINDPNFIGHPKLEYLQDLILNHFIDAGEGRGTANGAPPSSTRIMVFAHFRDSAEEIARILKRHEPMIRPHVFVGQASSKGSAGMDQRQQLAIIEKFKAGVYNTLVATSIGEEGLDIGEIDLIVCYDSSASPIRMLQRMGRTGRKRAGKVVLLLMRGKEEKDSIQANDNYEKMQEMIAAGTRFNFHDDRSRRIIPRGIQPVVDKRMVEIPFENTQHADLPEPRRRGKVPKMPPKKFHMPDGVRTGFVKASRLNGEDSESGEQSSDESRHPDPEFVELEPIPPLDLVLLGKSESQDLARRYQYVYGDETQTVTAPRLNAHPRRQRTLGRTKFVKHSSLSAAVAHLHTFNEETLQRWQSLEPNQDYNVASVVASEESQTHNSGSLNSSQNSDTGSLHTTYSFDRSSDTAPRYSSHPLPSPRKRARRSPSSAAEAPPSSPPPTAPDMRLPSQGISLGSFTTQHSSEAGDRAAMDVEFDSELADFVVDDAAPIPTLTSSNGLPSSSLPPASAVLGHGKNSFQVSQDGEDEDEDELPDVADVIGRASMSKTGGSKRSVRERDKDSEAEHRTKTRRKKRRVVDESSSE